MDHFIDVRVIPDAEMRGNVLLNKIYSKLHRALFALRAKDIGVSFPEYKVLLGSVLRIHGTEAKLSQLDNTDWLGGLAGYCRVTPIQTIPKDVTYRTISRVQANMTEAKLRRLQNRGAISDDDIKRYKAKMFSQGLDNPYVELESASNGRKYRRYLAFGEQTARANVGAFDSFGLSKVATIPWF